MAKTKQTIQIPDDVVCMVRLPRHPQVTLKLAVQNRLPILTMNGKQICRSKRLETSSYTQFAMVAIRRALRQLGISHTWAQYDENGQLLHHESCSAYPECLTLEMPLNALAEQLRMLEPPKLAPMPVAVPVIKAQKRKPTKSRKVVRVCVNS